MCPKHEWPLVVQRAFGNCFLSQYATRVCPCAAAVRLAVAAADGPAAAGPGVTPSRRVGAGVEEKKRLCERGCGTETMAAQASRRVRL